MTAASAPVLQPIPVPEHFPVAFEPGDDQLLWEFDRMHFPGQVTPYEATQVPLAIANGMTRAMKLYKLPVHGWRTRIEHGYVFNSIVPVIAPPQELEELGRRAEAALMPAVAGVDALWNDRLLPEIREHLRAMQDIDLRSASLTELIAKLDECEQRLARLWEIHFEIVLPAYIAISEFDELYRDLIETDDQLAAYRLLQGFPNRTVDMGHDLWRLSRRALESPAVMGALLSEAASDVPAKLAETRDGREFLAALGEHLDEYGHRAETWGLGTPSFIEDPTPVIMNLRDYVAQPDAADPAEEARRLAREREEAIAEARERLSGYPAPLVAQFEAMLASAQCGLVISEDHGFYIDTWSLDNVRQVLMETGRRFAAAGAIADAEDILMLSSGEIRDAAGALQYADLKGVVAERRAELARYAGVAVPPVLGSMPPGPPPNNPVVRFAMKFIGAPQGPAEEEGTVKGSSGSAGKVTGTARVIRTLAEAERLREGDILVAPTTAPPWTPLFATAAAVVTDTGGVLSHCAVVAREYGIPAVVGAGVATALITDGDVIEVDGDAGLVRIVG